MTRPSFFSIAGNAGSSIIECIPRSFAGVQLRSAGPGIPNSLATLAESTTLLNEMSAQGGLAPNEPLFEITTSIGEPLSEKDRIARLGIHVEVEPNQTLANLSEIIVKFIHTPSEETVTLVAVSDIFSSSFQLAETNENAAATVSPELYKCIQNHIVACCAIRLAALKWIAHPKWGNF